MKNPGWLLALVVSTAICLPSVHASPPAELCNALRGFVESVQPNGKREFTFRTSWGENFKGEPEPALAAKRCEHHDYEPAKKVCNYLMEHASTEFSGVNVKNAITCLSKKTRFAPLMEINAGSFSFSYGSDNRGALIDITLQQDVEVGGMAFHLAAAGY